MNNIPRVNFAHLPTPIEHLERISKMYNGPVLLVKRDDQTGLAFGGNKTRKLEFLVAEAQNLQAKTLVTAGAVQSNHCRQTAAAAAKFGLDCTLVLAGDAPSTISANYLLDNLFGAEIVWTTWETRVEELQKTYEKLKFEGKHPYLVPYGGSNSTGAMGYVNAIKELKSQNCNPDWIVFPSSSGGTQAGLVAGAKIFDLSSKILGISVDESADVLKNRVAVIVNEVTQRIKPSIRVRNDEIIVITDYCKSGYGNLTDSEVDVINIFAKKEGLLLDPVYTGRAAAGLIDLIKHNYFSTDETVLFWHTGGTPSLFASRYQDFFSYD
jgi:D-cysteine desulfhydrase family pyridoxal phosphate-dependent enzyme